MTSIKGFFGIILAIAINIVLILIGYYVLVYILGLIGIHIPGQIIELLRLLFVLYILAAVIGVAPNVYPYPWITPRA